MKDLTFYINPQGLLVVQLKQERPYFVSGVAAFPIKSTSTKNTRHILIFN